MYLALAAGGVLFMSMEHKAFEFDWQAFEGELLGVLVCSLEQDNKDELISFIDKNHQSIKDPYKGEPIDTDWKENIEVGDIQEYVDYALTKYYEPCEDYGLGYDWAEIDDSMPEEVKNALLGKSINGGGTNFDPGRMGSYFQSPEELQRSLSKLKDQGRDELSDFINFMSACITNNKGMYVTF